MELVASRTNEPLSGLVSDEQAETVRRAVEKLPDNQRMAILLHRFEEMSYAEVATVMKISHKAVKSLLFRARENLRRCLEGRV